ncbi:hypothetical protein D3C71_1964950 [compost metagenome]
MSSKSSSPDMVPVSAVVLPPVNRLSRSFSSFTSIIERMAWFNRSEYACILRPSAVVLLNGWQASAIGSAWPLQHERARSSRRLTSV